jgi:hypothetical protein
MFCPVILSPHGREIRKMAAHSPILMSFQIKRFHWQSVIERPFAEIIPAHPALESPLNIARELNQGRPSNCRNGSA